MILNIILRFTKRFSFEEKVKRIVKMCFTVGKVQINIRFLFSLTGNQLTYYVEKWEVQFGFFSFPSVWRRTKAFRNELLSDNLHLKLHNQERFTCESTQFVSQLYQQQMWVFFCCEFWVLFLVFVLNCWIYFVPLIHDGFPRVRLKRK